MYVGGRCHLWKKCHYETISLICKKLEYSGQKGTLQYWWKSYEGRYIKKDLQLLGSNSVLLNMARVGSQSTEILLYVKRVSVLEVQRLITRMEEMNNRRGCVIEELDEDGNIMGEAVSEEPMMMGNMVHDEDEEDGEDADFFGGVGLGYYFPSDVDMPQHEGSQGEEEQVNDGEEEQVNEGEDMTDFGTKFCSKDDEEETVRTNNENVEEGEEQAVRTNNENVWEGEEIHDGPHGEDGGQPNEGQPNDDFIDPDYNLEDDDEDLSNGMEAARSGIPETNQLEMLARTEVGLDAEEMTTPWISVG
ncbi:hypothetical protein M5689_003367 [Euphorbia peplus]|nr:hypothetical protein M5689_003367 [Euphorbia peplus]